MLFIVVPTSRPIICSCCWNKRNELRKCSRCIKAAVIDEESILLRNNIGSIFGCDVDENNDAYAADKRCRSIIESANESKFECEEAFRDKDGWGERERCEDELR